MATIAKQENIRRSERVTAGLARAKRHGAKFGRPRVSDSNGSRTTLWRRRQRAYGFSGNEELSVADAEHLARVEKGARAWNAWRSSRPKIIPDLSAANLSGRSLDGANFTRVDLERANLSHATLTETNFVEANLAGADLSDAVLSRSSFLRANVRGSALSRECLARAD